MKRIYLLMILFVAFAGNAIAQARTCDLEVLSYVPSGYTLELKGAPNAKTYIFAWGIKNHGPDSLMYGDTMFISTPVGVYNRIFVNTTGRLLAGDSLIIRDTITLGPGTAASGTNNNFQWCDSVFVWPKQGTTITDNKTNKANKKCTTITTITWATGIDGINSDEGLAIYPNPTNSVVNITRNFKGKSAGYLTIADITGKVVYKEEIKDGLSGEHTFKIDVSGFAAGIHFVKLATNEAEVVSKLTVQ